MTGRGRDVQMKIITERDCGSGGTAGKLQEQDREGRYV